MRATANIVSDSETINPLFFMTGTSCCFPSGQLQPPVGEGVITKSYGTAPGLQRKGSG